MHRFWICTSALLVCSAAPKAKVGTPAAGIKTPGVLIPFANLKSEATITLSSPPAGLLFNDSIVLLDSAGIHSFDPKTNQAYDPARTTKGIEKPCGGLTSAFNFLWTLSCGKPALVKVELRAPRGGGGARGGRATGAPVAANAAKGPPDGLKSESLQPDAPKPEAAKTEPPKPLAPPVFIETAGPSPARVAVTSSADSIWLLADNRTALQRIDPQENTIAAEVRLPAACSQILFAENSLWVTCPTENRLLRIDPRTNLVDKRIDVTPQPVAVAFGEGSIWVLSRKEGKIARIDPKTNRVTATIDLGITSVDGTLAFGEGSLWASAPGYPVMRIAPATDKVVQQFHGEGGGIIHFGLGSVWVSSSNSTSVTRFDPKRITATLSE